MLQPVQPNEELPPGEILQAVCLWLIQRIISLLSQSAPALECVTESTNGGRHNYLASDTPLSGANKTPCNPPLPAGEEALRRSNQVLPLGAWWNWALSQLLSYRLTVLPKHSSRQRGKHRTVKLEVPDMTRGRFSGQALTCSNDDKRREPFQRAAYVDRVYLERSTVPSGVVIKSSCCPHAVWYVT